MHPVDEDPEPGASSEESAGLSPHRMVLRMISVGAPGGLAIALGLLAVLAAFSPGAPGFEFFVVATAGGAAGCALLAFAEEVARRVSPASRPLAIVAVSLAAAFVVSFTCAWAIGLVEGGPGRGYRMVVELVEFVANDFGDALGIAAAGLVPFVIVGGLRGANPWRTAPCPLWMQFVGGACAGIGSTAVFHISVETLRELWPLLFFSVPTAVAPLAMAAGEALEARLLARFSP